MQVTAINASTTYGLDTSAANNFGLGSEFRSTLAYSNASRAGRAAPSWWWLLGFIVLVWLVE